MPSNEAAIAWRPAEKPILTYACWRPHSAPTTGQAHVHVLLHYKNARRVTVVSKLGHNKPPISDQSKLNFRQYCINDTKKDGSPKGVLAPFQEIGEWGIKMGERNDLLRAKSLILSKKRYRDVIDDDDLVVVLAKYPRFCQTIFSIKSEEHMPRNIELYPWQTIALEIFAQKPKERQIIWIHGPHGSGKSTFYAYVCTLYNVQFGTTNYSDTVYTNDHEDIIWFELTKGQSRYRDKNPQFDLYHQLERLSNVCSHASGKFHGVKRYIWAHIVVTSNEPPPFEYLPNRFVEINTKIN